MTKARGSRRGVIIIGFALGVAGCRSPQPAPPVHVTATTKEIMDAMIDPAADALWNSLGTIFSEAGTEVRQPRTEEDWANLRRRAVELLEAPNLLLLPGRQVAKPGDKPPAPDVEESPEQIQAAIEKNPQAWVDLVHGLQTAALPILKAIDAKDVPALAAANGALDIACENCHLKYWYPKDALAQELNKR